jgi:hypothetical protein
VALLFPAGLVLSVLFLWRVTRGRRRKFLMEKYGDAKVVEAILKRQIWQGMTRDQLCDSWGNPVEIGREIQKKAVKETFKYDRTGRNRFKKRVSIENGIVVGWKVN